MNRIRFLAGALAVPLATALVAGSALAVDDPSDPEIDSGAGTAAHFATLDANHDGYVTKDEAAKEPTLGYDALLKVGDANHDGRLNRGEFESATNEIDANGPGLERGGDHPEALFVEWDTNRDDRLSLTEVPAARRAEVQAILDSLGRKDGTLTFEEFISGFGKGTAAPAAK